MNATLRNKKATGVNAYDIALLIARKSGIIELLKSDNSIEGLSRLENLNALLDGIKEFVEDDELIDDENPLEKSLSVYLQNIALITDMDEDKGNTDVVTLMSVHAAKGLEYRSVFIVGLEENLFPSYMSLSTPNQLDEERRLFYVAITRAKDLLVLTYSNSRYQFGQMRFNDPSRFIEEIPPENIDSIIPIKAKPEFGEVRVLGGIKPRLKRRNAMPKVDASGFVIAAPHEIKEGMKVLHMKFGEGKVMNIDERQVASIHFSQLVDNADKRIMLQYAKLQILE